MPRRKPEVKIAAIGAGSYVFGPGVLSEALLIHKLSGIHLAMMDVDGEIVEGMAGVGRRMAREGGLNAKVTAHTNRSDALDGADFVVTSVARQQFKRFAMDCAIVDRFLPDHWVTEFGGIAGISYSLRQIALITEIAEDMKKRCPKAWLLNVSNPLPRVAQAAHESGVRTAGFCSVSLCAFGVLWRVFKGRTIRYPFSEGRETWDASMGGLNHFSWLVGAKERATGEDVLPELTRRLKAGEARWDSPISEKIGRETGCMLLPYDGHVVDFLATEGPPPPRHPPLHGTPEERAERIASLREIAAGRRPWDKLIEHTSWEKPVDLIAAMAFGKKTEFNSLNLINEGQVPGLPANVFVETPCTGTRKGPAPRKIVLPEPALKHCLRTALVTDAIVRAARERKRALVHEAVELDPTIRDKTKGKAALDDCLATHADVLPKYE